MNIKLIKKFLHELQNTLLGEKKTHAEKGTIILMVLDGDVGLYIGC